MSTPGKRKALKALASKKKKNKKAYESGADEFDIGGKKVKTATFLKKIGGKPKSYKRKKK